jgi:hypothetical protein
VRWQRRNGGLCFGGLCVKRSQFVLLVLDQGGDGFRVHFRYRLYSHCILQMLCSANHARFEIVKVCDDSGGDGGVNGVGHMDSPSEGA